MRRTDFTCMVFKSGGGTEEKTVGLTKILSG